MWRHLCYKSIQYKITTNAFRTKHRYSSLCQKLCKFVHAFWRYGQSNIAVPVFWPTCSYSIYSSYDRITVPLSATASTRSVAIFFPSRSLSTSSHRTDIIKLADVCFISLSHNDSNTYFEYCSSVWRTTKYYKTTHRWWTTCCVQHCLTWHCSTHSVNSSVD